MNLDLVLQLVWSVFAALVGISLVLWVVFRKRMKSKHPQAFTDLGSPSLLLTLSSQAKLMAFVWRRHDRRLGDPVISAIVVFSQVGTLLSSALVLVVFFIKMRMT